MEPLQLDLHRLSDRAGTQELRHGRRLRPDRVRDGDRRGRYRRDGPKHDARASGGVVRLAAGSLSRRARFRCLARGFSSDTQALARLGAFERSALRRAAALSRRGSFRGRFLSILLRMHAEILPRSLGHLDPVVARRALDVREGELAVGILDADDLIEARDRVADMTRVGQRLFALFRKREDAIGQIALPRQPSVPFVRFPSRSHA